MADLALRWNNCVLYFCSCSQQVKLEELYFCRHCKNPRCNDCVSTQIDTTCISCPHCFESVPQSDAKTKKNRCVHCFQCPMCSSTLTTRYLMVPVTTEPPKDEDDQSSPDTSPRKASAPTLSTPKSSSKRSSLTSNSSLKSPGGTKYYFLSCTYCRWTTREVGIKDKRSPLDFKEKPHPHLERYVKLTSYYRDLEMLEHLEQEKRKKLMSGRKTRPPYASLLDKTELKEQKELQLKEMTIASVPRDPEPIPDAYYTDPVDITTLSSLQQMYIDPAHQPKTCSEYWPQPLQLISKKIHRCKGCDHILLKSDVNLNTVRFKLQHIALYVFPRIRLLHSPNLTLNEPSIIPVSIVSPVNVNYDVTLSFGHYIGKIKDILSPLILPEGSFVLRSSDDDMSDILDDSAKSSTEENMFILSSEPGRLVLKFVVIPQSTEIDTKIAFVVNFTYQPLVEVENDESSTDNTLRVPIMINCGHSFS